MRDWILGEVYANLSGTFQKCRQKGREFKGKDFSEVIHGASRDSNEKSPLWSSFSRMGESSFKFIINQSLFYQISTFTGKIKKKYAPTIHVLKATATISFASPAAAICLAQPWRHIFRDRILISDEMQNDTQSLFTMNIQRLQMECLQVHVLLWIEIYVEFHARKKSTKMTLFGLRLQRKKENVNRKISSRKQIMIKLMTG